MTRVSPLEDRLLRVRLREDVSPHSVGTSRCGIFSAQGIRFSRIPERNTPTPDYKLLVDPEPIIVEVKEFGRPGKLRESGYCSVPFVRQKIRACWKQFELHGDQRCCLMLSNESSFKVSLQPELILSAVFGEYFQRLTSNSYRFSGCASMQPDRNTRISAVVGLLSLRVQRSCMEAGQLIFERTEGFRRELSEDEANQIHRETSQYLGQVESAIRAVVVENPFAPKRLPESIFTGPFDDRVKK